MGFMGNERIEEAAASEPLRTGEARPSSGHRAMVVEDESELATLIGNYLERDGFEVTIANDGQQAVTSARQVDPDVVVLDLGLPSLDGIEVCRQVRTFSDAYVVMLTARSDEVDTLIGLSVGADDYMTKPFSPRELTARIQAMLRRPRAAGRPADVPNDVRAFGSEFDLLAALSERPRMAFSRRQLIDTVWGPTWVGDEHLVDVHVGHLRRKLGDDAVEGRFVRTVRGVGYRMGSGR
jgi:DNA-binding response OmpR family regulator